MLISCQRPTLETPFSPKKELNVDFTRMHDHRDAHLTYDGVKCSFHEVIEVRILSPESISSKHYKSCRFEIKLL